MPRGSPPGVYYSPDDFWWLHQQGKTIERLVPEVQPRNNPGLMDYDQTQLRELLTHYGKIDALFLDGEAVGLRDLAWRLDPDIIVTRGAIKTPEMTVPGMPLPGRVGDLHDDGHGLAISAARTSTTSQAGS